MIYWIVTFILITIAFILRLDLTPLLNSGITTIIFYGIPIYILGAIIIILKTKSVDRFEKFLWVISLFITVSFSMPLFWYIRVYKDKSL